jgi:hypothetical protein
MGLFELTLNGHGLTACRKTLPLFLGGAAVYRCDKSFVFQ